MLEIITDRGKLDLGQTDNFSYTIQVSDVFNLSASKASYINTLSIPKTANNVYIMQGLGIVGDQSNAPYQKINAQLNYSGFTIINSGWLEVTSTDENTYKINIKDGMIDFFKMIEGKKIGVDLDLSASNHNKNIAAVVDSQNSNIYRYLIADYGGKMATNNGNLNIDYLTPSLSPLYLLHQVENYTGYAFVGDILKDSDVTNLWLTYPKAPVESSEEVGDYAGGGNTMWLGQPTNRRNGLTNIGKVYMVGAGSHYDIHDNETLLPYTNNTLRYTEESTDLKIGDYIYTQPHEWVLDGALRYNTIDVMTNTFTALTNGVYRVTIESDIAVFARKEQLYTDYANIEVWVNNAPVFSVKTGEASTQNVYVTLNEGDILYFKYFAVTTRSYDSITFLFRNIKYSFFLTNFGSVDFGDALKDFLITDWFKDFLWRYGLTAIANNSNKTILLQTFNEKIVESNAVDWSDKLVSRTSESNIVPTFGQRSLFTHKYNGENIGYFDGVMNVNNANIDESKVIIASKMYAAENGFSQLLESGLNMPILTVWQKEVKANSKNEIEINYKSLNDRFYYAKAQNVTQPLQIESEVLNESSALNSFSMSNVADVHFNSLVPKYYPKQTAMINVFKLHNIELDLSFLDIINLDLSKIFYIKQEGQFYILNKLIWTPGKFAKGEFIRVIL